MAHDRWRTAPAARRSGRCRTSWQARQLSDHVHAARSSTSRPAHCGTPRTSGWCRAAAPARRRDGASSWVKRRFEGRGPVRGAHGTSFSIVPSWHRRAVGRRRPERLAGLRRARRGRSRSARRAWRAPRGERDRPRPRPRRAGPRRDDGGESRGGRASLLVSHGARHALHGVGDGQSGRRRRR